MIVITHFFIGIFVGAIFFGKDLFLIENIAIILIFSIGLDLDHLILFYFRPKNHLRSFIQEPPALIMIAIPAGVILGYFLGFYYFWAVICLYASHIIADYLCVFEAWPLDPFNTEIVKKEGMGLILPLKNDIISKKAEFYAKFSEIYVIIALFCLDFILLYFIFT